MKILQKMGVTVPRFGLCGSHNLLKVDIVPVFWSASSGLVR